MVNMDYLIAQIRNINADTFVTDPKLIHDVVFADAEGLTENDFFLAFQAAKMLPGWVTEESQVNRQSFYEDLFG